MASSSSSLGVSLLSRHQVFISFRGGELRRSFIGFLTGALRQHGVNFFIDEHEKRGEDLEKLFMRIEESSIALVIFSKRYSESMWCLDELVKIEERVDKGQLVVVPIFYKLEASDVRELKQEFGTNFKVQAWKREKLRVLNWEKAMVSISGKTGLKLEEHGDEYLFIVSIIEKVKEVLHKLLSEELGSTQREDLDEPLFGIEQRLKQLEEKLEFEQDNTCIVGVVGMPGIGKTVLAKRIYDKWVPKFGSSMCLTEVSKMLRIHGLDSLRKRLLGELLKDTHPNIEYAVNSHDFWKDELLKRKVFIVLDDVNGMRQIESLLGNTDWIKEGSKIVITTSDESLLRDLVSDFYEVPRLNDADSLKYFSYHVSDRNICALEGEFKKLSKRFLDYAKGNPLVLKALGVELCGKEEAYWEQRVETLAQISNKMIQDVLRRRYDELSENQKDAFLDIACFFRSESLRYVKQLLDLRISEFTEAWGVMDELKYRFLAKYSGDQVEMDDVLYTFGKELAGQATFDNKGAQCRLWNHQDIIRVLENNSEMERVRGLFLDMSEVKEKMSFDTNTFNGMCNLRYLKIYSSDCPRGCNGNRVIEAPEELQFTLNELRCLDWLRFPLEKLPSDFNAKNLVYLSLPYSSIRQIWEGVKDTPNLKWVDLSHSHELSDLSGLSNAQNLERLNLEGCTSLVSLPKYMENMKSLLYLNMRQCKRLRSLPNTDVSSLKILILSGCSELQEFEVISENLETLYLDGTKLKGLPPAIGNLQRLALLNLKGCKMLEHLPDSLGKLIALEDLILSGCSKLQSFPMDTEDMRCLRILLVDGTRVKELPTIFHFRCSLRRLCLSGNSMITDLEDDVRQLYHLKWLDLKHCVNLKRLPTLPPKIEFVDAHGCHRLSRVADPLAICLMTEQIPSTFIFTDCNNLGEAAKEIIVAYAKWKCQLHALECYYAGLVSGVLNLVNTCFPGCDVPMWFHHQAVGPVLEPKLQPHWYDKNLSGILLCAVISFQDEQNQSNCFSVKCALKLKDEDSSCISIKCNVGNWTESGRIESDHVFMAYSSFSNIAKRLESQYSGKCIIPIETTLKFYVTDGTCEVVKCGFSFVYAEPDKLPFRENSFDLL
ncbi:unnamed protein product [Arabis nemorensis]|uniref:ADP-ribosyl cyclase/cyclic ADP-ribose hydrolase n=1 Tax=Arabis nemorensis TaxID=586526 RepID=A0A565CFB1_9BRAS|nr:unnamed protein product [Arabis nemorensis]